jgi:hypothetical protein
MRRVAETNREGCKAAEIMKRRSGGPSLKFDAMPIRAQRYKNRRVVFREEAWGMEREFAAAGGFGARQPPAALIELGIRS